MGRNVNSPVSPTKVIKTTILEIIDTSCREGRCQK